MSTKLRPFQWFYRQFGVASVHATGRDAYLIILTRTCRMFAFGTNSLVLALFFSALEFSDYRIGLFMTLTLLGDVVLSIVLTLIADRVGRRRILFAGSFLMVVSGVIFATFENFWILLVASVLGVITITGGDFGPFRAIEESMLSHLTSSKTRSDVLAWYVTTSALGSSIGSEASGRIVHYLQGRDGWSITDAYHTLFWIYAAMGVTNALLVMLLSDKCEIQEEKETEEAYAMLPGDAMDSPEGDDQQPTVPVELPRRSWIRRYATWFTSHLSQISAPTRAVMYKLWLLLIVDSLADGMVPYSLTNYYMDQKFHPPKSTLGDITSASYFLAAISTVFAAPLARKIGLVNTMVFTHIPSSAAVLFFPLPGNLPLTVILLLIRAGLNNMDQAPRSAFIAAVVKPEERTSVMGITSTLRTLAATTGPSVTGILAGSNRFWIAFVAAGAFRLAYDTGLYAMFVNMKLYQHEEKLPEPPQAAEARRESHEEMLTESSDDLEMTEMQKL